VVWAVCFVFKTSPTKPGAVFVVGGLTRPWSNPVASLPDEKNKRRDQRNHDKHPILAFETQKGEMLNEKLHHSRSLFCAE
jgi:hypothetical protein